MNLPIYNYHPNANKPYDYSDSELSYIVELLRDYLAVELYKYSSAKEITNVIEDQIKNGYPIIIIKCSYFQRNNALLLLIHHLLEEEIERLLLIALEISLNCDLSKRKIIVEHDHCISAFW